MDNLRLWFSKTGLARYTSHLDAARLFARAVRQARIPVWYTEGFNPHPAISFDYPLPLGTEAMREPVEIRLTEPIAPEDAVSRMNSVLPEGFLIVDAELDPPGLEISACRCVFEFGAAPQKIDGLIAAGGLTAEKSAKSHGKKIMKTVDVAPFLADAKTAALPSGGCRLECVLPLTPQNTVSPALIADAFSNAGAPVSRCVREELLRGQSEQNESHSTVSFSESYAERGE
ncbi:MAG: TIGR03936 family radical SAM-associated protein [Clostridia bacterium]|nr:TIGR03936 family radical SAM-associated protein [Clostridia bacterium]